MEKLKEKIPYKDKKVTFRVRAALKLTGDKKNTKSKADFTKPETLVEGFNNNDENFLESSDSQGLSDDFNKILEESQDVEATKRYSRRAATREGAKKVDMSFLFHLQQKILWVLYILLWVKVKLVIDTKIFLNLK